MTSRLLKTCSWILVLALLIQMVPAQVFASEQQGAVIAGNEAETLEYIGDPIEMPEIILEDATVLMEIEENRTEFTKEFKLSNGMHMAIVYPEAVHYEKDGQWKDIDNTLQIQGTGRSAKYTTTAGSWSAVLPQQLRNGAQVRITKGDYTVSFGMSGELRSGTAVSRAASTYTVSDREGSTQTLVISSAKEAQGQVCELDYSKQKEEAQYPEVILDRLKSRMAYEDVYTNTDIIYDVTSYQLKESIVINQYDESVRGYLYTLDTGELVPIVNDDRSIDLLDPANKEVVMTMPAPYMIDNAGVVSNDVTVTLEQNGNSYLLAYQMPMGWLADEERMWPIVLDPVVVANSSHSNILDQFVAQYYSPSYNNGALMCGYSADFGIMHTYIQYANLPTLSSADVVVNASLSLQYLSGTSGTTTIEAHKVLDSWDSKTITWSTQPAINSTIEDYAQVSTTNRYCWEITDVVREWYSKENTGVMLKTPSSVETGSTDNWKKFYSIDYDKWDNTIWPYLTIVYRNMNGLESYWDYTTVSAGRAGTGYVNNYTGNLTWVHNDIGFDGNRMPVSISHIYNSNDKATNSFGLGYGWRTNFNQTVEEVEMSADSVLYIDASYVWRDADGTAHYFIADANTVNTYHDEDGLELILTVSSGTYTITDKYGNTSNFDSAGRLVSMSNNQATKSSITITYVNSTDKYISKITDGAGRFYNFSYSNNLLTRISYTGSGSSEISYISFGYTNSQLTSITSKDGKSSTYGYSDGFMVNAADIDGYRINYTYSSTEPKRVVEITEYDINTLGRKLAIEYAHNQTTFTDHNDNVQITQFNDWGNVISVQDGEGRAQFAQYAVNDHDDNSGKGNQLTVASKLQNTVVNLLNDSSFEHGSVWTVTSSDITQTNKNSATGAYIGTHYLEVKRSTNGYGTGVYGPTLDVVKDTTYTFSAYLKTGTASAYLVLSDGIKMYTSEIVENGSQYTRVEVSYTATTNTRITPKLILSGTGTVQMDCVQLEQAATASRYNLIQNGDFRTTDGWSSSAGRTTISSAAPLLSSNAYQITGSPTADKIISQTVQVSGGTGDTFVLSGWAKGDSAPLTDESREFGLRLIFNYTNINSTTHSISFNPDCDSDNSWQYVATPVVAAGDYSSVTIEIAYCNNVNTVYFDGIQLFKEEYGSSYTYDDDGNVISVVDLQKQETTYEYYANDDLKRIIQNNTAKMTYEYDDYHNVIKATTATGIVYEFTYDEWGNNTSVSIKNGSVSITSSATYTANGNLLASTTDALGKITTYGYNANTGMLEFVQYPEDTTTTRTEYTYDSMYRLATATADVDAGSTLTASYTYTDDLLTKLTTGSTTYNFSYGNFAQISSIKVGSQTLATYTYTAGQNHYLSTLDYGNGDKVQYTYDNYGRVTKETFEDGDTVAYQYDNTGALATVTDSATGIKTTYYYDFTDRLMKYVEIDGPNTHSVGYSYDSLNNLTKLVETINGVQYETTYTYDADNRITAVTNGLVEKQYTYDAYGRLVTQITKQNGTTVQTETFTYTNRSTTAATAQIKTHKIASAGYTVIYTYTYDYNGNILSVSDGSKTTTYVYDSANQLIRENNQAGGFTHIWTYDDAGNILSRKEYGYTTGTLGTVVDTVNYSYGNSAWGDLLTAVDSYTYYDAVGNPLNNDDYAYTWEHGRELASLAVSSEFAIISHPKDSECLPTGRAYFTVEAAGTNLSYRWQWFNGSTWINSTATGATTNSMNVGAAGENGTTYRCVVTDGAGNVLISKSAKVVHVPILITSQPTDWWGTASERAAFTVQVTSTDPNLTYQWQWRSGSTWKNSAATGVTTNSMSVAAAGENGTTYRCMITDSAGNVAYSEPATVHTDPLGFITQPEDCICSPSGRAYFSVEAYGTGLTYQWQWHAPGSNTWYNSTANGNKTNAINEGVSGDNGTVYRCKITDAAGNVAYSEPATVIPYAITWEFTYDANGMRTHRTNGAVSYEYIYNGGSLSRLTVTNELDGSTKVMDISYDAAGKPMSLTYNGTRYIYATNIQGDVIAILNTSGNKVVEYTYDAWGNILSVTGNMANTLGHYNPLRYRGYVYDQETGLYYLQSRYYNPTWGRFINADAYVSTGQGLLGNNMFAYCGDNPVNSFDPLGYYGICVLSDPMNAYRSFLTPGMFGGGGGGSVAGVSSSYYARQNVSAYDRWWRNSCYNPNMTWSNGATSQQTSNVDVFSSFIENPKNIKGKTASDVSKMLGETWQQGTYGSQENGWKFINGDKLIAYHPGGGRHVGSYYKLSSAEYGKIKIVGADYVSIPGDKAIIIWCE